MDTFKHECAVFAIFGDPDASMHAKWALHMMQHRGQQASGMVTLDGTSFHIHKENGRVQAIFRRSVLDTLPGETVIGHNRYKTCGPDTKEDAQPHVYESPETSEHKVKIAGASNGDLPHYEKIRARLESAGYKLKSHNDGE